MDAKAPESLFRDHVVELHKRACAGFAELLGSVLKPLLGKKPAKGEKDERQPALSTFAAAEALMQEDPRFARAPPRER